MTLSKRESELSPRRAKSGRDVAEYDVAPALSDADGAPKLRSAKSRSQRKAKSPRAHKSKQRKAHARHAESESSEKAPETQVSVLVIDSSDSSN